MNNIFHFENGQNWEIEDQDITRVYMLLHRANRIPIKLKLDVHNLPIWKHY